MGGGPKFPHTVACDVVTDASSGTPYRIGGQAAPVARRQIRARDPGRRERAKGRPSSEARGGASREKPLARVRSSRTENGHTWSRRVS